MINDYIAHTFEMKHDAVLCYFDFDHFKPYNDYYGFRSGDRVILLFADLMHKVVSPECFKGHIGGDDFFLGAVLDEARTFESVCAEIESLIQKFEEEVREFYDIKDREQGCIIAEDREGNPREFKLLGVSSVVIRVGSESTIHSAEQLHRLFAVEKKTAKKAPDHMSVIDM